MSELILHVGYGKTGTTSLQNYLASNRDGLAQLGICYPGRTINHARFAQACGTFLPDAAQLRDLRNQVQAESARCDKVILSSEGFEFLRRAPGMVSLFGAPERSWLTNIPAIERRSKFGDRQIQVVCYLREFLERATSNYAQHVQLQGITLSFERYLLKRFARPLRWHVNFLKWLSDKPAQFRLYDRNQLRHGDIVEDFFHTIGVPLPSLQTAHESNPSISGNLLAFKLLLNRHKLHSPVVHRAIVELARMDTAYRGRMRLPDERARLLRARYSNHNKTISDLVGDVATRSFEDGVATPNHQNWRADLERFLSHQGLSHLKSNPAVCKASSDHVAKLLGL